ncbi:MAG: 5'-nucleotidase C-terminal domain-containing protein [Chloroflexota bacterium]|jgi:2',3'-cyclic-nucleotide 2'-phosphodiesterase (5'-nucleotidase family)|nr:5'-nucleotidase C-terminal domain-containing protein [Anaerolineae bacterium]HMM27714.1 5'-nucleotidase C-terminal domain-containing protein [Aggregatilineaceae bacterium]
MTQITILYTGDIHGRVERLTRAAYLAQIHRYELTAVGRHVLLLDAGDVEERQLLESELTKGAAMFRLLKAAGYNASAVGNGAALTYGPQVLSAIAKSSGLPLVCANMLTRDVHPTPVPGTSPTLIIPCGPVRVGLLGLTSQMNGLYERFYPVKMPDVLDVAWRYAHTLRAQGCEVVGVVSHLGYDLDVQLVRAVPDLSFVIGGHSHTLLDYPTEIGGVPICHAGHFGRHLGRLDLTLDGHGRVAHWFGQLIHVPEDGPEAPEVVYEWRRIQSEAGRAVRETVGYLNDAVDLASDRACGMGQLLADALRVRFEADAALCITGHLYSGLPAGPVSLGDLIRACQSPASAGSACLTGAQILRALEFGAAPDVWEQAPHALRGNAVGVIQVSGLSYRLDHAAPAGKRVSDVRIMGRPVERSATYRIAATDYELMPQRGYVPDIDLSAVSFDSRVQLREILQDHLAVFNPLAPGLRPRILMAG